MITGYGFFLMREPFDRSENTSLVFGSGIAMTAGLGKEYYDSRSKKGVASFRDLIADVLGIGLTVLLIKIT